MTTQHDNEKEQVALVFCLGGGELMDEPWGGQPYWYEGAPDYVGDEHDLDDHVCRTVVTCALYGNPDPPEGGWELIASYRSSGERECWCMSDEEGSTSKCVLCEGDGIVYLGDGWAEVVYRAPNSVVWPDED